MGWWSLGKNGGIGGVMDAPRTEGVELDLIMGDGPADSLGNFLDEIKAEGGTAPTKDAMAAALVRDDLSGLPEALHEKVRLLKADLVSQWREIFTDDGEEARDPYPQELQGCIDFVMYADYDTQEG